MNAKAAKVVMMGKIPTSTDAGMGAKFANKVARRQELKKMIEEAEHELGDKTKGIYGLNQEIEDAMSEEEITVLTCGGWTVTRSRGKNVSMKREKVEQNLLEYGMPADDIVIVVENSTDIKEYTYIQVTNTKVLTERAEKIGFTVGQAPPAAKPKFARATSTAAAAAKSVKKSGKRR